MSITLQTCGGHMARRGACGTHTLHTCHTLARVSCTGQARTHRFACRGTIPESLACTQRTALQEFILLLDVSTELLVAAVIAWLCGLEIKSIQKWGQDLQQQPARYESLCSFSRQRRHLGFGSRKVFKTLFDQWATFRVSAYSVTRSSR